MTGTEKLFVAVTRSTNLLSGSLRIVSEHGPDTPVEWLKEEKHSDYPDRWIFVIRGEIIAVKSPKMGGESGTHS